MSIFSAFLGTPDRVAFTIFGLDIMWYGITMTSGIVAGAWLAWFRAPLRGIDRDKWIDALLYSVPCGIIGARAYYVIFEWDRYKDDLIQVFNLRGGGLAYHGGLIGGLLMLTILVIKWKQNPIKWMDLAAPGFALGQAIARWGNYFNSEAHGVETDLPWAIEVNGQMVHPTFLYESLWCFLLMIFLLWFDGRQMKKGTSFNGQIFSLYLILYSVERYFVEGLRTDSLYIGSLRQAQVFSIFCIILGVAGYRICSKFRKVQPVVSAETADENAAADEAAVDLLDEIEIEPEGSEESITASESSETETAADNAEKTE